MTEPTEPKLGQETGDLLVNILGWGYAAEVDLLIGEIPLQAWDAAFVQGMWTTSWGTLYLTSQRLVWIRWRASFPGSRKVALIALDKISDVTSRVLFSRALFSRLLVVRMVGGEQHLFLPMRHMAKTEEMVSEINSILRERGLLRD